MSEFRDFEYKLPLEPQTFGAHIVHQVQKLQELERFFTDALEVVENLDDVNGRLETAGRRDLIITDRAPMNLFNGADGPPLRYGYNNFSPKLGLSVGFYEVKDRFGNPERILIPPTPEQILVYKERPRAYSFDDLKVIERTNKFPGFHSSKNVRQDAFTRCLNLFPECCVSTYGATCR